jgi:YVTN family beta-propeller protein
MSTERKQQIIIDPYIGPRPFKRDIEDQKRFFGRDDETDEIVSLILGHKLVLIYAQSGAGKTSIFNAKVAPTLEKYGFQVLPTARVGIASDTKSEFDPLVMNIKITSSSSSVAEVINSYMLNALQSLSPEIDSKLLFSNSRLSSFLREYFPITNDNNKNNKIKAQALVFDQLEELFNFYPGTTWRKQQEDFFEQITEALEENPLLRIVFVIREDYLAELDHFAGILPGRLRARFRLERLGKDAALLAIRGPIESIKSSSSSCLNNYSEQEIDIQIEMLVEELLKIQVEDPFSGKPRQINGEFVEPIHLQIVCQRWWQEISLGKTQTAQARLKALADVDSALQEFYERSIYDATTHTNISEGIIRRLCEEKLITSSGTRAFVHWGAFSQFIQGINKSISEEKIDKVISILESKYLIRAERRSGAKWYEITHDRLIGPIKASNLKWKEHERNRKSRRHRMIIIPSIAVVAIAVSMIVFFYFNPFTHSEAILLGRTPSEISINPQTNMIYVTGSDYVSVIDGTTNKVVDDITLDQPVSDISINTQTNMIYAAGSNSVHVRDAKTKTMVADIPVEKNIIDLSVNQQTNRIYAAGISSSSSSSDSVYVIDGNTNKVVEDIILLNKTRSYISINPQTNMIYAVGINSSSGSDSVSVIDGKTNKVVDDITLGQPAYEISINPQTNMIYAAGSNYNPSTGITSGSVSVIDGTTNKVVDDITLDQPVSDISINPQTNMIYVAGSDSVYVIDAKTKTMVVDISVDKNIIDLSINPQTNMIYVSDFDSNAVYIINGMENRIEASIAGPEPPGIKVGKEPSDISTNPQTNMIYVDNLKSDSLSVIDGKTNKVVDNIRIKKPSDISINPQTNMIYAVGINSSSVSDSVSVIDGKTNKVVDDITLGQSTPEVLGQPAYEISINPQTNMIYVLGYSSVSVIDGTTNKVVDDITLGQPASGISINPQTNMIYVAGSNSSSMFSGSVSVIDGTTNKVVDDITLDQPVSDISINPQTNMIYVLGYSSVSVIDGTTNKVVDDITLDQPVSDISINPQTNMIYAAGSNYNPSTGITSGSVSVIDGKTNKVVEDIPLIHIRSSDYIDANPKTNIVYVVSAASDSITPINATTNEIQ